MKNSLNIYMVPWFKYLVNTSILGVSKSAAFSQLLTTRAKLKSKLENPQGENIMSTPSAEVQAFYEKFNRHPVLKCELRAKKSLTYKISEL
jgi:hypothetical protein